MNAHSLPILSQQILERLKGQNPATKSQKAIANLVGACDFLQKHNLEISVAVVGKYCQGKIGGPVAQSIRNNPDYRAYVLARRSEQAPVPAKTKAEAGGPFRTGDINIDAHIQTLEFELMKTKSELRSLRQALPRLGEYDLKAALEEGHLVVCPPTSEPITDQVRTAIDALLDKKNLSSVGLELVKTGQIIAPDQNDAVLLTKPQVDALRALTSGKTTALSTR